MGIYETFCMKFVVTLRRDLGIAILLVVFETNLK